jgi:ketosteroid isomerase-like protein
MKSVSLFIAIFLAISCSTSPKVEEAKQQILATEKQFETMVKNEGMAKGFTYYAADSAVINRNSYLLKGKDSIMANYSQQWYKNIDLKWNATFVDVAASCDLGYTYGNYTYAVIDSSGRVKESKGFFHTVWKKQTDGSWKYVWD